MRKFKVDDKIKVHDLATLLENAEKLGQKWDCKSHYQLERHKRILETKLKIITVYNSKPIYKYFCEAENGERYQLAEFEFKLDEIDIQRIYDGSF